MNCAREINSTKSWRKKLKPFMTNSVERELTKILDSIVDDLIYQSKKEKKSG